MKQIIALGGGGFSTEAESGLLDDYVAAQADAQRPKVCFVPTASGDAERYVERFYADFQQRSCTPSHLSLFKPVFDDLERWVLSHDIIYVGGGNTRNMLALWREWGLDTILRKAWDAGVVLAGVSAGALCWFEEGVTDSFGLKLAKIECLGLLPGSCCPHYDGEPERRPAYQRLILDGRLKQGLAADDGVALHFVGKDLHRVLSSHPQARAFRVYRAGGRVAEDEIVPRYLGAH